MNIYKAIFSNISIEDTKKIIKESKFNNIIKHRINIDYLLPEIKYIKEIDVILIIQFLCKLYYRSNVCILDNNIVMSIKDSIKKLLINKSFAMTCAYDFMIICIYSLLIKSTNLTSNHIDRIYNLIISPSNPNIFKVRWIQRFIYNNESGKIYINPIESYEEFNHYYNREETFLIDDAKMKSDTESCSEYHKIFFNYHINLFLKYIQLYSINLISKDMLLGILNFPYYNDIELFTVLYIDYNTDEFNIYSDYTFKVTGFNNVNDMLNDERDRIFLSLYICPLPVLNHRLYKYIDNNDIINKLTYFDYKGIIYQLIYMSQLHIYNILIPSNLSKMVFLNNCSANNNMLDFTNNIRYSSYSDDYNKKYYICKSSVIINHLISSNYLDNKLTTSYDDFRSYSIKLKKLLNSYINLFTDNEKIHNKYNCIDNYIMMLYIISSIFYHPSMYKSYIMFDNKIFPYILITGYKVIYNSLLYLFNLSKLCKSIKSNINIFKVLDTDNSNLFDNLNIDEYTRIYRYNYKLRFHKILNNAIKITDNISLYKYINIGNIINLLDSNINIESYKINLYDIYIKSIIPKLSNIISKEMFANVIDMGTGNYNHTKYISLSAKYKFIDILDDIIDQSNITSIFDMEIDEYNINRFIDIFYIGMENNKTIKIYIAQLLGILDVYQKIKFISRNTNRKKYLFTKFNINNIDIYYFNKIVNFKDNYLYDNIDKILKCLDIVIINIKDDIIKHICKYYSRSIEHLNYNKYIYETKCFDLIKNKNISTRSDLISDMSKVSRPILYNYENICYHNIFTNDNELEFINNDYKMIILNRYNPFSLIAGKLTGCCQWYDGVAKSTAYITFLSYNYSVLYFMYNKTIIQAAVKLENGILSLDSLESNSISALPDISTKMIFMDQFKLLLDEFINHINKNTYNKVLLLLIGRNHLSIYKIPGELNQSFPAIYLNNFRCNILYSNENYIQESNKYMFNGQLSNNTDNKYQCYIGQIVYNKFKNYNYYNIMSIYNKVYNTTFSKLMILFIETERYKYDKSNLYIMELSDPMINELIIEINNDLNIITGQIPNNRIAYTDLEVMSDTDTTCIRNNSYKIISDDSIKNTTIKDRYFTKMIFTINSWIDSISMGSYYQTLKNTIGTNRTSFESIHISECRYNNEYIICNLYIPEELPYIVKDKIKRIIDLYFMPYTTQETYLMFDTDIYEVICNNNIIHFTIPLISDITPLDLESIHKELNELKDIYYRYVPDTFYLYLSEYYKSIENIHISINEYIRDRYSIFDINIPIHSYIYEIDQIISNNSSPNILLKELIQLILIDNGVSEEDISNLLEHDQSISYDVKIDTSLEEKVNEVNNDTTEDDGIEVLEFDLI